MYAHRSRCMYVCSYSDWSFFSSRFYFSPAFCFLPSSFFRFSIFWLYLVGASETRLRLEFQPSAIHFRVTDLFSARIFSFYFVFFFIFFANVFFFIMLTLISMQKDLDGPCVCVFIFSILDRASTNFMSLFSHFTSRRKKLLVVSEKGLRVCLHRMNVNETLYAILHEC